MADDSFNQRRTPVPTHDVGLGVRLLVIALAVSVCFVVLGVSWRERAEAEPRLDVRAEGSRPSDYRSMTVVDVPPWVYTIGNAAQRCDGSRFSWSIEPSPCHFACYAEGAATEAWGMVLPEEACAAQPSPDRFNVAAGGTQ